MYALTLVLQAAERAEAALRAAGAALRELTAEKDPPRPADLMPEEPVDLQDDMYFKAQKHVCLCHEKHMRVQLMCKCPLQRDTAFRLRSFGEGCGPAPGCLGSSP